MSCPAGHQLTEFRTNSDSFSCDGCMKDAQSTDTLFGCRKCNYDLCQPCYDKEKNNLTSIQHTHVFDWIFSDNAEITRKFKNSPKDQVLISDEFIYNGNDMKQELLLYGFMRECWNEYGMNENRFPSDEILLIKLFLISNCIFYLECTPNGYSPSHQPEGDCTLWLAIKSLPHHIQKLDIIVQFVCDEIGYEATRRSPNLGRGKGCSWSMGMWDTIETSQFEDITSWTFKCYITIREKIKRENTGLSVSSLFITPAFCWIFPSHAINTEKFKKATIDEVVRSEKFVYDGCTFYLECTPNGYSSVGSREGECTLWLAVESLPEGIDKLDVTARFVCDEIGYDASRRTPKLGRGPGCSWSFGMLHTTQTAKFMSKSSWIFYCYITIHQKMEIPKIEPVELSTTPAYNWTFDVNGTNKTEFKNSVKDQVLNSEKFVYDECTFYLECTPNGFSPSGSKEGECTLWLAVESLPDGIGKLDVTVRFVCDEIGYDASRRTPKLGRGDGCSWSVGMLETTTKSQFESKSCWTFKCYITIHEKVIGHGENMISLERMMQLLSLLGDKDD